MSKGKKKTISTIIGVILILIILLLAGGLLYLYFTGYFDDPNGLYVVYNGEIYDSESSGIELDAYEATFTIGNTEDWGVYTVDQCSVSIIPYITSQSDILFTVDGDYRSYIYSGETDLNAAINNGEGITVAEDGTFTISIPSASVAGLLTLIYGADVTAAGDPNLADFTWIALYIEAPNGHTLTLPLLLPERVTETIEMDPTEIVFK